MLQEIKSAERLKGLGYMKRTECKEKHYRTIFEIRKNIKITGRRNTQSRCNVVVIKERGKVSKRWQ
jgi:hypothetical protein